MTNRTEAVVGQMETVAVVEPIELAAEPALPRNRGGRPRTQDRLRRRLTEAREKTILALLRTIEDPNTPAAVVAQSAQLLERFSLLDQAEAGAVARLQKVEARLA